MSGIRRVRKRKCQAIFAPAFGIAVLTGEKENPSVPTIDSRRSDSFRFYGVYKPRPVFYEHGINEPPAMRVRIGGYTQKFPLLIQ